MRNKIYFSMRGEVYNFLRDHTSPIRNSLYESIVDKVESKVKGRTFFDMIRNDLRRLK
jgi:hypothetical protein